MNVMTISNNGKPGAGGNEQKGDKPPPGKNIHESRAKLESKCLGTIHKQWWPRSEDFLLVTILLPPPPPHPFPLTCSQLEYPLPPPGGFQSTPLINHYR